MQAECHCHCLGRPPGLSPGASWLPARVLNKWPQGKWKSLQPAAEERYRVITAFLVSDQPLPACSLLPPVLHGLTSLTAHWLLRSSSAFCQISFCGSHHPTSLAFFFLSYFDKHLIHFLIPGLIPSNLHFQLAFIFLKFTFQHALSCSQYF